MRISLIPSPTGLTSPKFPVAARSSRLADSDHRLAVPQLFKPPVKGRCLFDFVLQVKSVAHKLRIVKGMEKREMGSGLHI